MFWLLVVFIVVALIMRPLMRGGMRPCVKGCHGCGRCWRGAGKEEADRERPA